MPPACRCSSIAIRWILHETLEFDRTHATELLFTPGIDRDIHALFLKQIANADPHALHVVIAARFALDQ